MKLNESMSKTCTHYASSVIPITVGGTVLGECDDLDILGVTFDSNIFEKHHRSVSRAASRRFGNMRKSWRVFSDCLLLKTCFCGQYLVIVCSLRHALVASI